MKEIIEDLLILGLRTLWFTYFFYYLSFSLFIRIFIINSLCLHFLLKLVLLTFYLLFLISFMSPCVFHHDSYASVE